MIESLISRVVDGVKYVCDTKPAMTLKKRRERKKEAVCYAVWRRWCSMPSPSHILWWCIWPVCTSFDSYACSAQLTCDFDGVSSGWLWPFSGPSVPVSFTLTLFLSESKRYRQCKNQQDLQKKQKSEDKNGTVTDEGEKKTVFCLVTQKGVLPLLKHQFKWDAILTVRPFAFLHKNKYLEKLDM